MNELIIKMIEPKHSLSKERQHFGNRELISLIVPILIEQLLTMLVGIADTLMVSYAGDAAVSGVSLVNQLNNVFIFIFGAIASGGAVVASQYVGRNDSENGKTAAGQLMLITALISLLLTGVSVFFRKPLLLILFGKVEADVMSASLIFNSVCAVFSCHCGVQQRIGIVPQHGQDQNGHEGICCNEYHKYGR